MFGLHRITFQLFTIPHRLKLLVHGEEVRKLTLVSFFLLNCYTCFNEVGYFECRPPSIEVYIPLAENIPPAPVVDDSLLGDVYRYH